MLNILSFVGGLALLVAGAELLVKGASRLAISLGLTPLVVGLTVVAFGTSAPEIAVSVGAVAGGPAVAPLEALHGRTRTFATVAEGLQALADGRIDAFVHDEPELAWQSGMVGGITLAPVRFGPQAYAMALPQGSALREPVNQAVLDTLDSGEWVGTLRYYLGPE